MSIIAEWFKDCRSGNTEACRKLYLTLWLNPVMVKEWKKLFGPVVIVPIPKPWPGPDPSPLLDSNFLHEGDLLRLAMGPPSPQPSFISRAEQLHAATELRAALDKSIKAIDAEIERLRQ